MSPRATILVADDQPIIAEALASSLDRWFDVVGFVTALSRLDAELAARSPDILLLDLSFGATSALTVLPDLVNRYPKTSVVILTAHIEPALAEAALRAGALGYVVKQSAATELRVAIEEVLAGRTYVTPLLQALGANAVDAALETELVLSDRQREILNLLRTGATFATIAQRLGISTKTVEYHVDTVGRRIGISGREQITRWADRFLGQVDPTTEEDSGV